MSLRRVPKPGLRGRLVLSAVAVVAAVLAVLTFGFNLVLGNRLDHDANKLLETSVSAQLSALRVANGRITLPEAPDDRAIDSRIWVFQGARMLEQPRANPRNDAAAAALASGPRRFRDVAATDTRLYAVPIVQGGGRVGAVVAGISLKPYEQTEQTALIASAIVAALALLAVSIAAGWLVSRSLRPVGRMTTQAAEWSERDLDRRFALGTPHDELTQLAATLDALLDRLAASLRREQRFSAELSHELRTPLANVMAEAQFALRHAAGSEEYRAGFAQILQSATQMSRTLETLMTAARAELNPGRTTSDATAAARAAADACAGLAAERGVDITIDGPPTRVAVDAELVERVLAPLLENACRYGRSSVRVSVATAGNQVLCTVDDDGPGVAPEDRELIFEPGRRGSAAGGRNGNADGAGLGLALARRLARAGDGEVEVDEHGSGGRFIVRLPAA